MNRPVPEAWLKMVVNSNNIFETTEINSFVPQRVEERKSYQKLF